MDASRARKRLGNATQTIVQIGTRGIRIAYIAERHYSEADTQMAPHPKQPHHIIQIRTPLIEAGILLLEIGELPRHASIKKHG